MSGRVKAGLVVDRIIHDGRISITREQLRTVAAYLDRDPRIRIVASALTDLANPVVVLLRKDDDPDCPNGMIHAESVVNVYRSRIPELMTLTDRRKFRGAELRGRYPELIAIKSIRGYYWLCYYGSPIEGFDVTFAQACITGREIAPDFGVMPATFNRFLWDMCDTTGPDDPLELRRSTYVYLRALVSSCPFYTARVAVYSKDKKFYAERIDQSRSREWLESRRLLSPVKCLE
jgi:hypothetical protein